MNQKEHHCSKKSIRNYRELNTTGIVGEFTKVTVYFPLYFSKLVKKIDITTETQPILKQSARSNFSTLPSYWISVSQQHSTSPGGVISCFNVTIAGPVTLFRAHNPSLEIQFPYFAGNEGKTGQN